HYRVLIDSHYSLWQCLSHYSLWQCLQWDRDAQSLRPMLTDHPQGEERASEADVGRLRLLKAVQPSSALLAELGADLIGRPLL
ncbi:MAG: hypothetical protein LC799_12160, partial [Actinobacteria bacterium]|nr:hypothetical protein [Actinomycetota bacterium]